MEVSNKLVMLYNKLEAMSKVSHIHYRNSDTIGGYPFIVNSQLDGGGYGAGMSSLTWSFSHYESFGKYAIKIEINDVNNPLAKKLLFILETLLSDFSYFSSTFYLEGTKLVKIYDEQSLANFNEMAAESGKIILPERYNQDYFYNFQKQSQEMFESLNMPCLTKDDSFSLLHQEIDINRDLNDLNENRRISSVEQDSFYYSRLTDLLSQFALALNNKDYIEEFLRKKMNFPLATSISSFSGRYMEKHFSKEAYKKHLSFTERGRTTYLNRIKDILAMSYVLENIELQKEAENFEQFKGECIEKVHKK